MKNVLIATHCIEQLLYANVIDCTIGVMLRLKSALESMDASNLDDLDESERDDFNSLLLKLTSESIREALHRGELHITNAVIRNKNRILKEQGIEIPEDHQEIDGNKFGSYRW